MSSRWLAPLLALLVSWTLPVAAQTVTVSSAAPAAAAPGAHIRIRGENLDEVGAVLVESDPAVITHRTATLLVIEMPSHGGRLLLVSAHGATLGPTLRLLRPPVIERFDPPTGDPGQDLIIWGHNLDDPELDVHLGDDVLALRDRQPDRVTVTLPDDAMQSVVRIYTSHGEDSRTLPMWPAFRVQASRPGVFYPGDRIAVTGEGLNGAQAIYTSAPDRSHGVLLTRQRRGVYSVVAPALPSGCTDSPLELVDPHGRVRALDEVDVVARQTFDPSVIGARVECEGPHRQGPCRATITGEGFDLAPPRVRWQGRRLHVEHADRERIVATLERAPEGRHPITVRNGPHRFETRPLLGRRTPTPGGVIGMCDCPDDTR